MKISSIGYTNGTSFRGIKEAEDIWQESKPTIKEAMHILGDKNLSLIMHGNSFPSVPSEDISIGSPYSNGAKEVVKFFGGIFDKIILGPWGKTSNATKNSPYNSTLESKNPYFINFEYLTTEDGGNLLSKETFAEIVENKPDTENRVNYEYVEKSVNKMTDEIYSNYKLGLANNNPQIKTISHKFNEFVEKNEGIRQDSVFEILTEKYGTSDFYQWDEIDRKLPVLLSKNDKKEEKRYYSLLKENTERINKYMFTQFLASEHTNMAPIKYVADKQVAIGSSDLWKIQDVILREIKGNSVTLGVPGDEFSSKGRCWGMPVIDYTKLFDKKGNLTESGKGLYNLYRKIFRENKGGVRIDHFQGVIDPFVCINDSAEVKDGAGRLYSSPDDKLLKKYSIIRPENIDETKPIFNLHRIKYLTPEQIDKYSLFFKKIILDAAQAEGLSVRDIMPEDLGSITKPTLAIIDKYKVGSMKVTEFVNPEKPEHIYRGINSLPKDFIMTGTHDNKPLVPYFYDMSQEKFEKHLNMLKRDLNMKRLKTKSDRTYGIKLKFAELFVAPARNVQVFFSHLLGMTDWYNKPGDKSVVKWTLRMPNNFKEVYFNNMVKGLAFNPFDSLSRALSAKGVKENQKIINKLKSYERRIIKELK